VFAPLLLKFRATTQLASMYRDEMAFDTVLIKKPSVFLNPESSPISLTLFGHVDLRQTICINYTLRPLRGSTRDSEEGAGCSSFFDWIERAPFAHPEERAKSREIFAIDIANDSALKDF